MKLRRHLYHLAFTRSRDPWASEVVGYAHGAVAVAAGIAVALAAGASFVWSAAATMACFVALRAAMANKTTVWLAAFVGIASVACAGGALGWFVAKTTDGAIAPLLAAVLGSVVASVVPVRAYARIISRRRAGDRDSLLPSVR